jgi:hypothetical protein
MKKILAILITGMSATLAVLYWGEPEGFGWIVAVTGWIDKCFDKE